ncbi:MAG: sensor histidine kinase [Desulfobacteraceae bacterium]|nr:MAG: sensor histidine kinase [Desulfobacteraceae bacterium]
MSKKLPDQTIKTELLIHDLKVPISVIDAGAKSLLNRQDSYGPLTEKQVKVLKRILRNTLTTQRLVNDALELGRSREGVMITSDFLVSSLVISVLMEVFDLSNANISDIIRQIESYEELCQCVHSSGLILCFNRETWQTTVHQDEAKVRQILRNLVTNAFKHRANWIEIAGCIEQQCLVFRVKDDGKGIPPVDHQRIFQTYFSGGVPIDSAIRSHGLGLAGVMVLLRDMGGELILESDDGKGAEFIVKIPI